MRKITCSVLIVLAAAGCADAPARDLLTNDEMDADSEARRNRMNVTVQVQTTGEPVEQEMTVRTLVRSYILDDCYAELALAPADALWSTSGCNASSTVTGDGTAAGAPTFSSLGAIGAESCNRAMCRSLAAICVANRLLELSTAVAPVTFMPPGAIVTVPPQDEESKVAYSEEGFFYASWAATVAGENLRLASGRSGVGPEGVCSATDLTGKTLAVKTFGERFALMLGDATLIADEAARAAMQHHASVSDADFSRTPDRKKAAKLALIDPNMSRSRAAHVATGGAFDSGYGDFTEGACPTEPPSDSAEEAMRVLRFAAPKFAAVTDTTKTFVNWFEGGAAGDYSLRERLAHRLSDPTIAAMSAQEFLESRGLREADFQDARTYMGHEAKAFARDTLNRTLPPQPVKSTRAADGTLIPQQTTIPLYAATGTPATPPPAAYFRGRSRFAGTNLSAADLNDGTSSSAPTATYGRKSLAQLHDYTAAVARDLAKSPTNLSTTVAELIGEVVTTEAPRTEGRVHACYYYAPFTLHDRFTVHVYGETKPQEYELVRGVEGLRCAVEGSVDGAPCQISEYQYVVNRSEPAAASGTGFSYVALLDFSQPGLTSTDLYLVKRTKPQPRPGDYVAVAPLRLRVDHGPGPSFLPQYCTLVPINKEIDELVEQALKPSTEFCGMAEQTCAGPKFTDRIPLENELTSDGDPYESSWRVYLDRAKAAAERADLLGEQLLEAGLDMDRRIESAEEALEALCGPGISLSGYFPDPSSNPSLSTTTCTNEGSLCAGLPGHVCRNGLCIKDAEAMLAANASSDPAARTLLECLGDDSVHEYVAVGTEDLCVWKDTSGTLCGTATHECPYLADRDTGQCAPVGSFTGIPVPINLDLLAPPAAGGNDADPPPCAALREIREGGGDVEDVRTYFSMERMKRLAEDIGWQARAYDYSAVTHNGGELFSTGDPYKDSGSPSANNAWPCGEAYAAADDCTAPSGESVLQPSLFCSFVPDCNVADATTLNHQRRVRMNHRLARAVLALRILTGVGIGADFLGPMRPNSSAGFIVSLTRKEQVSLNFTNGHSGKYGTSIEYNRQAQGPLKVGGKSVCIDDETDTLLWTDLPGAITADPVTFEEQHASCSTGGFAAALVPTFKTYKDSFGTDPIYVARVWQGLGMNSQAPEQGQAGPFEGLVLGLLNDPPASEDAPWISPTGGSPSQTSLGGPVWSWDEVKKLTKYWAEDQKNAIPIARDGLRAREILDALELACEVDRYQRSWLISGDECSEPVFDGDSPEVVLGSAEAYLHCVAAERIDKLRRQILVDVPATAIDVLIGAQEVKGERGAAAGEFAAALSALPGLQRNIDHALANFASDIQAVRLALAENQNLREIAEWRRIATASAALASCVSGLGNATNIVTGVGALATCAGAAQQVRSATAIEGLEAANIKIDEHRTWLDLQQSFRDNAKAIVDSAEQIRDQIVLLRSALARLEAQRTAGLRQIANALMLGTSAMGDQFAVNTVMRRRYNTLHVRYEQARKDAINMAWLARRAIEQHLAISLENLTLDMALVEAPSRWVDEICTATGLDYARIRDESGLDVDHFAGAYIGDYVRKLEAVVQSYEHDFPFMDGQDTAVISLRDDVLATRAACETSVPNLLAYSALLDLPFDPEDAEGEAEPAPVWEVVGCQTWDPPNENCIGVQRLTGPLFADRPIPEPTHETGEVPGYRITFGPTWTASPPSTTSSFTPQAALIQTVTLNDGYYRLSWYGRTAPASTYAPTAAVIVRSQNGQPNPVEQTAVQTIDEVGWDRHYLLFHVALPNTTYQIAIVPQVSATAEHEVDLAGLMLEDISDEVQSQASPTLLVPSAYPPGPYVATHEAGIGYGPLCEDTTGAIFRTRWTRGCEQLCPAGFGTCEGGQWHCYWDLPLFISVQGIEDGSLLGQSGFANGNYNYRIDSIAVNLVGTGLRDCAESSSPSTCNASGSIPYSILHTPEFEVRNYEGDIYKAPLYDGRVEHGRALAAERYITNPISSGDRSLLQDYWDRELRGRPLTGEYHVRLWEEDGVVLGRLEDVQIILDYRFWTRFQ